MKQKTFLLCCLLGLTLITGSFWLRAESVEAAEIDSGESEIWHEPESRSLPLVEAQKAHKPFEATPGGETSDSVAAVMENSGETDSPQSCSGKCESYCSCWKNKGGGGPVMMLIFNRYNSSRYGDFSGPTLWYGGRGYGYIFDNRVRLGGMGAGGAGPDDERDMVSRGSDAIYYPMSKSRHIYGAYGGFTAEYVFTRGKYLEFPMGALLGFGYGGYSAELEPKNIYARDISSKYDESGPFIALQPMLGVEANVLQWLKLQVTASYLFAKPFDNTRHLGGFSMVFGLMFGRFWPDEWKMPESSL